MKDHSAEQRLRHYGPCYLAGAPASAGALPSKDRKNVQSAGLISGRSTEPAARAARAFDRDIMALLLHRAINRDIMSMTAGKFKRQVQLPIFVSILVCIIFQISAQPKSKCSSKCEKNVHTKIVLRNINIQKISASRFSQVFSDYFTIAFTGLLYWLFILF